MSVALSIGGSLLAIVLATAGVAKLLDLEGSRRAVAGFGVPPRLAGALGGGLPLAELATAALLIAGVANGGVALLAGGLSALALLTVFCAGIAVSLVRGRAPDCHCFGQLHSAPAGPGTLARNGALFAVASFVATDGDPAATAGAGAAALALLAAVTLLIRRHAATPEQPSPEGLPVGSPAPGFQLPGPTGEVHTLDSLRTAGLPVLLVFTDPGCGPCIELAPKVARWQRDHADDLVIGVIERDSDGNGPIRADEHGRTNVLLERDGEVADLYRAEGTPTSVLVGRDGAIASPVAAGGQQIAALVGRAVDGFESRQPGEAPMRPVFGSRLRRRELLVRGAGAWAAASAVLAWPLQAAAGIGSKRQLLRAERCDDFRDCPDPHHMRCRDGRCRCDQGFTRCNPEEATTQRCFNLQHSRDHCGGCNHSCEGRGFDNDTCCDGECGEFGRTRCNCGGDICSDDEVCAPNVDGTSSGCYSCSEFGWERCGNKCGDRETQRCCGNKLYHKANLGPGEWKCCGPRRNRRLVNIEEHERNCGACGRRCARDEFCYGGRCRTKCPRRLRKCGNTCGNPRRQTCCNGKLYPKSSGIRNCKGRCKNTKSDPRNCGGCGSKCDGPFDTGACCDGKCCDINADTCCPDGCKNIDFDHDNCGGCGNVCKPNEYCRDRVCTCPLGETC